MRPGHRARLDPAQEAVADHEVIALAQLGDQRRDRREVIARVGIAHDHEPTLCGFDAADQGAAITLSLDVDDPHAELARDELRAVAASVVGDDDFSGVPSPLDRLARFGYTCRERLDLV